MGFANIPLQYKVETRQGLVFPNNQDELQFFLNEQYRQGWKLVSSTPQYDNGTFEYTVYVFENIKK
ncbi:hypothetical protein [Paenibacillus sp. HW567]|uniref:hypothetical protein n=1 Tax=Paenibacillus sp. HW567 TaxID=1034769 RepID=UPI000370E990|nr:hypothetical protein [Paenibacillus sp. HW567]